MRKWTIVILAALSAAPAAAWNDRGHMVVAANAWRHLTPQTKNRVGQLLREPPGEASRGAARPAVLAGGRKAAKHGVHEPRGPRPGPRR